MRVPQASEPWSRKSPSLGSCMLQRTYLENPSRNASDHCKVRNILGDHGVRPYDDVVPHTDAPQHLGAGTQLDAIADRGRTGWIVQPAVTDGYAVTDQTVIADYGAPVNDDATVMLDGQPAADPRGRANADSAKDLDELIEHNVEDRPGSAHQLVTNDEARMTEAVHQDRPEAEAEQSLPLCPEIFQDPCHRLIETGGNAAMTAIVASLLQSPPVGRPTAG